MNRNDQPNLWLQSLPFQNHSAGVLENPALFHRGTCAILPCLARNPAQAPDQPAKPLAPDFHFLSDKNQADTRRIERDLVFARENPRALWI